MESTNPIQPSPKQLDEQFAQIDQIIESHRFRAISNVNIEMMLTYWEVGGFISNKLKSSVWGKKVVDDLADYLKRQNPKRRGFSKRNLYNMIAFYERYTTDDFSLLSSHIESYEFVQMRTAQLNEVNPKDSLLVNNDESPIVQMSSAQLEKVVVSMPKLLAITTFSNHIEIFNRTSNYEESVFYMLYAADNNLKTEELRRCIVNHTYDSIMSKEKMFSPNLKAGFPNADYMLKDKAFLDFLTLKDNFNEPKLHKEILDQMKEFILELGMDFIFMASEYAVNVGGSNKRIDLLFFHRGLQCLVAVELKAVDFQPEFVGKMDMYLEALDRDVKHANENPSIGIILCPSADKSMVEYTLSRSLSPTMITEYRRKLIPQEVLRKSLDEYCSFMRSR